MGETADFKMHIVIACKHTHTHSQTQTDRHTTAPQVSTVLQYCSNRAVTDRSIKISDIVLPGDHRHRKLLIHTFSTYELLVSQNF